MKKIYGLTTMLFLVVIAYAQTIKREYYDVYKNKLMAEYQVNSVGEKHGWFKGYDQQGILVMESNFKNNLWDGTHKEYSTYTGSRKLSKVETYKAGVLNGLVKEYGTLNGKDIVLREGNYLNGDKHGKWAELSSSPFRYSFKADKYPGFDYVKKTIEYDNGKVIYSDGEHKSYYYPSGKPYAIENYQGGLKSGDFKTYYPNANLESEVIYQEGKLVMEKFYYSNKQLKLYRDWRGETFVYEGYDENGNPDRESIRQADVQKALEEFNNQNFAEAEKLFKKAYSHEDAITMGYLAKSKAYYSEGNYGAAITEVNTAKARAKNPVIETFYNEVYAKYIVWVGELFNEYKAELNDDNFNRELENQKVDLQENDYNTYKNMLNEIVLEKKNIRRINLVVDSLMQDYKTRNVVVKKTLFVDEAGQPIMKDTYPRGEELFAKSMKLFEHYKTELQKVKRYDEKKPLFDKITQGIEKLNQHTDKECNSLNKQLKKVEDIEQIKTILNL